MIWNSESMKQMRSMIRGLRKEVRVLANQVPRSPLPVQEIEMPNALETHVLIDKVELLDIKLTAMNSRMELLVQEVNTLSTQIHLTRKERDTEVARREGTKTGDSKSP